MSALSSSQSSASVYAGCDLADDSASIYTATTLVGSEVSGRASTSTARQAQEDGGVRRLGSEYERHSASQPGLSGQQTRSRSVSPGRDTDALSLASETSTLRDTPRAAPRVRDPRIETRPFINEHTPSGISFSREFHRSGPTDYSVLEDEDTIPVRLRRASIDSTATDMLQRSAAAASQDGNLTVSWWNTMLPSPPMARPQRAVSTTQSSSSGRGSRGNSTALPPMRSSNTSTERRAGTSRASLGSDAQNGEASGSSGSSRVPATLQRASTMAPRGQDRHGKRRADANSRSDVQRSVTDYAASTVSNVVPASGPEKRPEATSGRHSAAALSRQQAAAAVLAQTKERVAQARPVLPSRAQTLSAQNSNTRHRRKAGKSPQLENQRGVQFKAQAADSSNNRDNRSGQRQSSSMRRSPPRKAGLNPPPVPNYYPFYTQCYCEENVYILATYLLGECQKRNKRTETLRNANAGHSNDAPMRQWSVDAVFVSNEARTVALWQQRAGGSSEVDNAVVWDYHVFLTVSCQTQKSDSRNTGSRSVTPSRLTWTYDLDTLLPVPIKLSDYLAATFRYGGHEQVVEQYQPRFRIVPAIDFLAYFASDRSHMYMPGGAWSSPPPTWLPIRGPFAKRQSNLMDKYVDISGGTQGIVIGAIVPTSEEARSYGIVVSLDELARDMQISGQACLGRASKAASRKEDDLSHIIDKNVSRLLIRENLGPGSFRAMNRPGSRRVASTSSLPPARISRDDFIDNEYEEPGSEDVGDIDDDEDNGNDDEAQPGMLLAGTRRVYGVRPPPAPPGQDPLHYRASVNFSGRGKRVQNALFPAYLHASLESRAQREREAAAAAAAAVASTAGGR